jgi:hypothetical protein
VALAGSLLGGKGAFRNYQRIIYCFMNPKHKKNFQSAESFSIMNDEKTYERTG